MAEQLSLILRALIFQADRHPGTAAHARLSRGLELRVTHSTTTDNYKLECGRKKGSASELELVIVAANWPQKSLTMEWHPGENADEDGVTWAYTVVRPSMAEVPA